MSLELDHFIGINTIQNGVLFHPNGANYIFSAGGNIIIGDLADSHSQQFLKYHDDSVTCLSLSASGRLLASGQRGENSNVCIWDFESRQLLLLLEEHDHMIQTISFSHDEKILATMGSTEDGKFIVWDMSNGCVISSSAKLPLGSVCLAHGGFVKDIKRRNTSHYLMCTAGAEGMLLWDLDPYSGVMESAKIVGDARATILRHITAVQFSSDYESLYGATTSGDYVIVNVRSMRIVQAVPATRMGLGALMPMPGGLLLGSGDCTVKYFDHSGVIKTEVQLDGPIIGLSPSADMLEVLVATANGSVVRLSMASMQYIMISESHTAPVVAIAFSEGGRADRFATASADGTIRLWEGADYTVLATGAPRREQERGVTPTCLGYSDILISGWSDGRVLAHAPDSGLNLWFIDNAHAGGVTAIALAHNRRFIVTGGAAGEVRLWELKSRELISHLKEHTQRVTALAIFEDDSQCLSASRDRCVLRWDLKSERRAHCHMQRMGGINDICITADPRVAVSVGQEKQLTYWDSSSPDALCQLYIDNERDEGRCVVRSHNGKWLGTGGTAGIVRIWDFASAKIISEGQGHSSTINSMQFSTDDKQIVSVGEDGSILIWNIFDTTES